ncbi:hypothetical protein HKCCSP123_14640 [Rhodobacterales bacterium HKCCSP123]|nr:hypothetical protein [Rhodobacterales bacterium HKCCSP123]
MRLRAALLASLLAPVWSAAGADERAGYTLTCATPHAVVHAADEAEATDTCAAVAAAHALLSAFGLWNDAEIRIEVAETLPVGQGYCVAMYDSSAHSVHLLSAHCLEGNPGRLGPFPDLPVEILFDSLIVHELAHAYVDASLEGRALLRVGHEYLAYALQLDAMDAGDRARVLAEASVEVPADTDVFSEALIGFAPLSFAAMAWLHFRAQGGNAGAVERVLTGETPFYSLRE